MPDRSRPLILAVDDDERVRALCVAALQTEFEVVTAENGKQALALLYQKRPDVVLLDVTMPVMDGWETCRRIRDMADVPVIMLTAHGGDTEVVRGLDNGADDYVTKPFRPLQLAARIRAVLRRRSAAAPGDGEGAERLSFDNGNLIVDTARRVAVVRGKEVKLSATEYRLLETLARHAGQVLSHDQILEHVWGHAYAGETGYVKTYIGLLRNKIEDDPKQPRYLLARRGLGYYLERRVEPREPEAVPGAA
ncbi:MAG TPA: response regulator transcription factor [Chloroflexota bacterium]|nr:response regulator transcription factor [Chloroflexota bacterium]